MKNTIEYLAKAMEYLEKCELESPPTAHPDESTSDACSRRLDNVPSREKRNPNHGAD